MTGFGCLKSLTTLPGGYSNSKSRKINVYVIIFKKVNYCTRFIFKSKLNIPNSECGLPISSVMKVGWGSSNHMHCDTVCLRTEGCVYDTPKTITKSFIEGFYPISDLDKTIVTKFDQVSLQHTLNTMLCVYGWL